MPEAALLVYDEVRTYPGGPPPVLRTRNSTELHYLSPTKAGEDKLGTKMEMIGKKYAMADAKINGKTFTFKMRS